MFSDLFSQINFIYIFIASFLFIGGIYLAPTIVDKNIRWLLAYPRWVAGIMERFFSARWGFLKMFLIILLLNNFSLFMGFMSGFLVIFPFIFAFLTGFNVAVIGYDLMGWEGIWHLLVNPVAWLEFPAAWLSFALGMRFSMVILQTQNFAMASEVFTLLLPLYFKYVFTLLVIAAAVESILIIFTERMKDKM